LFIVAADAFRRLPVMIYSVRASPTTVVYAAALLSAQACVLSAIVQTVLVPDAVVATAARRHFPCCSWTLYAVYAAFADTGLTCKRRVAACPFC